MTREEIEKLPGIVDTMLCESVTEYVREKIHKKITEVCNLAIEALSAEPCEDESSSEKPNNFEDTISFPKGTLKKRGKGYVVYNPEWLKENWQTELKVMGVECEDCISREPVLTYIKRIQTTGLGKKKSFEFIKKYVEKQPSVTPKQKVSENPTGSNCSEKPNNCGDAIERTMGNSEHKSCFIKEFGECTGTYCDECIRDTYHIRKASYDKGYADCIEELEGIGQFAEWVATEILDDMWEYNKDSFAEIACRKLAKLGIVRAKVKEWELVELPESESKE